MYIVYLLTIGTYVIPVVGYIHAVYILYGSYSGIQLASSECRIICRYNIIC
jgi:hypothetical protein